MGQELTFNEYAKKIRPPKEERIKDNRRLYERCNELIFGVHIEGTEVIKIIRSVNFNGTEIDKTNLEGKIGDCIGGIAQLSMELGHEILDGIALASLQKESKTNITRFQKVSLSEYQKKVKYMYWEDEDVPSCESERVTFLTMGLITEIGELASNHGHNVLEGYGLDEDKIKINLGKVLRWLTVIACEYDLDLENIIRNNIEKINSRYNNDGIVHVPDENGGNGSGR